MKDNISKWRLEIDSAEGFKKEHWGDLEERTGAGENTDYYEFGMSSRYLDTIKTQSDDIDISKIVTINMIFPLVKNTLPSLYYKNPHITVIPKRSIDETSSTYVAHVLNYYMNELDLKRVNKDVIFNAYVLGFGVCKIGYTTKFGTSPTEETISMEEKEKEAKKKRGVLEKLGLKKPKKEEEPVKNPDSNEYIVSESPFVYSVSPFNFGIDPAATSIYDARFVYEKVTRILSDVKKDKTLKNTADLKGSWVKGVDEGKIPETSIDDFKVIDLYEIHYKTSEGISILVLACDENDTKELRHDKSVYEMDGFQYELLAFNKHSHRLYPISDVDVVKELQNRVNTTFESILDQVDKYLPKVFVDETSLTEDGKLALRDGGIGAIVGCTKSPSEVVQEGAFTQLKADLSVLIDKVVDAILLETGLTRAQLMGLAQGETATASQIGQSGTNMRMSDKLDVVNDFVNREIRKLWQVCRQFVDLEELEIITGEKGVDEVTGAFKYDWLPQIDSELSDKMATGEYRFEVEMGSMEKPDLPIIRKQIENMANILMSPGVLQAFQMQGYKIELSEILKTYLNTYPNIFTNPSKIIKPIGQNTTGLLPPQQPQGEGRGQGAANMQQLQEAPPNMADIISQAQGEKGGQPLA